METATKKSAPGGKMVTMTMFNTQVQGLRNELTKEISHIKAQQTQMMDKFKRDLKVLRIDSLIYWYSRTCLKRPLKKNTKIGFRDRLSLYAGQKYCRMLQEEHSAILLTFIKLPFSIKTIVLYIFEWPLKTGFTVFQSFVIFYHNLQTF